MTPGCHRAKTSCQMELSVARTMLSSLARRTAEVATTAIRIAPPPFGFDTRYRALSPKVIDTGLISPARITLTCRTSPTLAMASESWIVSTCSTVFPPISKRTSPSTSRPFLRAHCFRRARQAARLVFELLASSAYFPEPPPVALQCPNRAEQYALFSTSSSTTRLTVATGTETARPWARPRSINANNLASGIQQGSTGKSRIQGEVQPGCADRVVPHAGSSTRR